MIYRGYTFHWLPCVFRYDGLRVGYLWLGFMLKWPDRKAWAAYDAELKENDGD